MWIGDNTDHRQRGYFAVVDHGNAYDRHVVVFHARFDGSGRISLEVDGIDQPGFYFFDVVFW